MLDLEVLKEDYEVFYNSTRCEIREISVRSSDNALIVQFHRPNYGTYDYTFNPVTLVANGYEQENAPVRIRKKARSVARDVWFLRVGCDDWDKDEWIDTTKFTDIEQAKAALTVAKDNFTNTNSPFKVRLRKDTEMADVYDFDQWAEYRFESGEWTKLPWANEPWLKPEIESVHFAHHSVYENDCSVAYWTDAVNAQRDNVSTMSGGRYLQTYYGDVLTPAEIESWVHKLDPPGDLVFSGSDPEAIYEAYDAGGDSSGLHSCMVYRDTQDCHDGVRWRSDGKSPVRVYGAGDLEVATLVRNNRRVARALVWRERKAVGRIYGDIGRMKTALMAEGYSHDGDWDRNDMHTTPNGLFDGARILKIPVDSDDDNYAMPYIDFSYRVHDEGDPDFFVLRKEVGQHAHRTDGLLNYPSEDEDEYFTCQRCGDSEDVDECYTVNDASWCYSCYDNHSTSCDRCGEYVSTSSTHDVDGNEWCGHCTDNHATCCDECDEYASNGNITNVHGTGGDVTAHLCSGCVPEEDHTDYVMINGRVFDADALTRELA